MVLFACCAWATSDPAMAVDRAAAIRREKFLCISVSSRNLVQKKTRLYRTGLFRFSGLRDQFGAKQ
jgi:hypothetical protein